MFRGCYDLMFSYIFGAIVFYILRSIAKEYFFKSDLKILPEITIRIISKGIYRNKYLKKILKLQYIYYILYRIIIS